MAGATGTWTENYDTPGERALAERLYYEKYGYPVDPYEIDGAQSSSGGPIFSWYVSKGLSWAYFAAKSATFQGMAENNYKLITKYTTGEERSLIADLSSGAIELAQPLADAANQAIEAVKAALPSTSTILKTGIIVAGAGLLALALITEMRRD